ncbi:hypothetical protein ACWATR_01345 [Nostoc sp. UIC 10890]
MSKKHHQKWEFLDFSNFVVPSFFGSRSLQVPHSTFLAQVEA